MRHTRSRGLPPPAALTGDWFGGSAVIAPSVEITATAPHRALSQLDVGAGTGAPGPVGGGWIGFLGYELTGPAAAARRGRMPAAAWGWTDRVLRQDPTGRWWLESLHPISPRSAAELAEAISTPAPPPEPHRAGGIQRPSADRHRKAVRACVEAIAAGEIFQANICTRFAVPFHGEPADVFAAGVQRFTPARAAFLTGDWGALVSLSPELFLARHGDVVTSSPIKGTLPRRGPADDGNAARLRSSAKDVAENVMIVDMARNDLGRVARTGTVTTPALLDVQPHPGVWHLVSDVRAELPPELPNSALLEAAFPPASVTGAPKPRALEIIAELEEAPRDVYCGAIGMVSPIAGLELNVAIRTLELADGQMQLGVGGGITADSDPEQEWQECLTKAAPVLSLLE